MIDRESLLVFAGTCFLAGVAVGWKCADGITELMEWLVR